jgi:hypothetical protein
VREEEGEGVRAQGTFEIIESLWGGERLKEDKERERGTIRNTQQIGRCCSPFAFCSFSY